MEIKDTLMDIRHYTAAGWHVRHPEACPPLPSHVLGGTTMACKNVVGRWERKRGRRFMHHEKRRSWRWKGGEEQLDVRSLNCHLRPWWGPGPSKGHVWIYGFETAGALCQCPWSILQQKAIWISLVWGHLDVQGLLTVGPSLTTIGICESWPCTLLAVQRCEHRRVIPNPKLLTTFG